MVTAGSWWSMTQTHPWLRNPCTKPHTEQLRNIYSSHCFNPSCTLDLTAKSTLLTILSIHKPPQFPLLAGCSPDSHGLSSAATIPYLQSLSRAHGSRALVPQGPPPRPPSLSPPHICAPTLASAQKCPPFSFKDFAHP